MNKNTLFLSIVVVGLWLGFIACQTQSEAPKKTIVSSLTIAKVMKDLPNGMIMFRNSHGNKLPSDLRAMGFEAGGGVTFKHPGLEDWLFLYRYNDCANTFRIDAFPADESPLSTRLMSVTENGVITLPN